jgi:hypothetical protein
MGKFKIGYGNNNRTFEYFTFENLACAGAADYTGVFYFPGGGGDAHYLFRVPASAKNLDKTVSIFIKRNIFELFIKFSGIGTAEIENPHTFPSGCPLFSGAQA